MKVENNQLRPQYLMYKEEYLKKLKKFLIVDGMYWGMKSDVLKRNLQNIMRQNIVWE